MRIERYAWLSVAAALATIALKLLAWWLTGSVGLLSDALESFVNLAAALLAVSMLRLAAAPPDEGHQYGHSKAEYFSAGIEGALIVLAASGILATAMPRLLHPQPLETAVLGLGISAAATAINLATALVLQRAGRRAGTRAVRSDRGPRALDGAARLGRHAHRADLGPRLLRRPGPRSIAASAAGLHDPALLLEVEPGVARKELSRLAVAQVDAE